MFEDEKGHLCCVCGRGKEGRGSGKEDLEGAQRGKSLSFITLANILLTVWRPRKYLSYSSEH